MESGRFGIPDWIRTNGLSLRRRPLYPAELRGRIELYFTLAALYVKNEGAESDADFTKAATRRNIRSRFPGFSRLLLFQFVFGVKSGIYEYLCITVFVHDFGLADERRDG